MEYEVLEREQKVPVPYGTVEQKGSRRCLSPMELSPMELVDKNGSE